MRLLACSPLLLSALIAHAQQQEYTVVSTLPEVGEVYWSGGFEWLLSAPVLDVDGSDRGGILRFAPFVNGRSLWNYDLSKRAGFFAGLSVSNLGFIYDAPDGSRYKFRTYNVGLPVGIKLGRMHGTLFFAGYELELPLNYKEKRFANERKEDKFNVWLSDRTEPWFHSVFIGFQGPGSSTLTLRYYLSNFHDTDYILRQDNIASRPYAGLNSNLVVLALGFALFDGTRTSFERIARPTEVNAWLGE
jgi:hypothetical protein